MERVFIGVAWPYANAAIHIGGFAGVYLPADAFARYHRLRGHEVLMVSGSDVHGTPILVTAEKEGASAEEIARRYDATNREALARLGVSFDLYTTTHTIVHERTVHELFLALLENGYIDRRAEENPYCPKHARFLPDRYVTGTCPYCGSTTARGDECDRCGRILEPRELGAPRCRLCETPAEFRSSEHLYLRLDKLEPKVRAFLSERPHLRPNVAKTARNFLEAGLHPTAITRDLEWGVPIPLEGFGSKRFYVWFDAVIGYLSASREWAIRSGRPEAWRAFWDPTEAVRSYYFLGKDNIFHHTIVWPAILLGAGGLQLPYDVPANEWLLVGGGKISKSKPADLDLLLPSLVERFAPDLLRFYAAQLAPQHHDTEFNWDEFFQLTDDVLSNQYGNLVQRILVLTRDRAGHRIPTPPADWRDDAPGGVGERLRSVHEAVGREFEAVHLKEALELALSEVREANRRVHEAKPWQAPAPERDRALYEGLWVLQAVATWLSPFLPHSSAEVYRMLGLARPPGPGDWALAVTPPVPGRALGEVRPLFPRREESGTRAPHPAPAAPAPEPTGAATKATGLDDGALPPLDLRVGRIRKVEPHPSADRLYVLEVDVGEATPRTLVAGIRPYYNAEALVDRPIAVLANLEPRTIRRITSQGMLLAADDGERAVLLAPPARATPGTPLLKGPRPRGSVPYSGFERTPIVVGRAKGPAPDGGTEVDVGGRSVRVAGAFAKDSPLVVRLDADGAPKGEALAGPDGTAVTPSETLPPGTRVR